VLKNNKSPGDEMSVQNLTIKNKKCYGHHKWPKKVELQSCVPYIRKEINYNVGVIEGSPY